MSRTLPRRFYARDTLLVAADLLGMHLVHRVDGQRRTGRIVETEAYLGPEDLAAHSARGRRTVRNEPMYGPPGHAYVFLIYGLFHCFNVVTRASGVPHAVLIRALEPVRNVELKTSGPGLLSKALGIDRSHSGLDLTGRTLFIARPTARQWNAPRVRATTRVGIDYAGEWARKPWRFYDEASAHVSRRRLVSHDTP